MKNKVENKKLYLILGLSILAVAIIFTILVKTVDVRPVLLTEITTNTLTDKTTPVGFATLNEMFHLFQGTNYTFYKVTNYLVYLYFIPAVIFGFTGLVQLIKRKSLIKVDHNILVLGSTYIVLILTFVLFEFGKINLRPILDNGKNEPSYPSSHTMTMIVVIFTAIVEMKEYIKNKNVVLGLTVIGCIYTFVVVAGRVASGAHWLTDIIGGLLFATGLVLVYLFFRKLFPKQSDVK